MLQLAASETTALTTHLFTMISATRNTQQHLFLKLTNLSINIKGRGHPYLIRVSGPFNIKHCSAMFDSLDVTPVEWERVWTSGQFWPDSVECYQGLVPAVLNRSALPALTLRMITIHRHHVLCFSIYLDSCRPFPSCDYTVLTVSVSQPLTSCHSSDHVTVFVTITKIRKKKKIPIHWSDNL